MIEQQDIDKVCAEVSKLEKVAEAAEEVVRRYERNKRVSPHMSAIARESIWRAIESMQVELRKLEDEAE